MWTYSASARPSGRYFRVGRDSPAHSIRCAALKIQKRIDAIKSPKWLHISRKRHHSISQRLKKKLRDERADDIACGESDEIRFRHRLWTIIRRPETIEFRHRDR